MTEYYTRTTPGLRTNYTGNERTPNNYPPITEFYKKDTVDKLRNLGLIVPKDLVEVSDA